MKPFSYRCDNCNYTAPYNTLVTRCPQCSGDWLEPVYDLVATRRAWEGLGPVKPPPSTDESITSQNEQPLVDRVKKQPRPHRITSSFYTFQRSLSEKLRLRDPYIWRYWEILPLRDPLNIVSLGEGWTPLTRSENLGSMLGNRNIFFKDERQGPTASFKDRQASVAISMAKEADVKEMVVASTGNVAISYSAYCARAGIKLWAFLDSQVPSEKMREVTLYSTEVIKVSSSYDRTKEVAAQFAQYRGIFLDKGLKAIAAREAMKTVGLEICEQLGRRRGLGWIAPDWYVQAVSGGMGPIGVWQGFQELYDMGLIHKMPKLAIIQTEGCAPMVNSFNKGLDEAEVVTNPASVINVLATGSPGLAYPYLRRVVLEHGGAFVKVGDKASFRAMRVMAQMEGLSMEPAAAVACAGLIEMVQSKIIATDETVVVNISGHTFPVEKQILENEIVSGHVRVQNLAKHEVEDVAEYESTTVPREGLLSALQRLDERVKNIAIIEDEPDARVLLRRILQHQRRYNIYEAADGASGITLIRDHKPDLVLLDLMMPGIDGFTILDIMKTDEDLHHIPVIVITAKDLTREDYRRLSGRVETLLQKGSFMEEELYESINEVLN
ncbi:pyridoxal-phosphate dependent enzyme [Anaerolineales bacterium HSG6]|nr:pyridoxal-phosphate dependent enzyme [Anaerolineales bacterium HSG6]